MSANYPPPQAGGPSPSDLPGAPGAAPDSGGSAAPARFVPPPGAGRDNLGPGLVAGGLVAIVAVLAYGALLRALAHDNGDTTELGYGPLAVGALVGIAAGKVGGRRTLLPVAAALLTVLAVVCGDLFGTALIQSHLLGGGLSVSDLLFHHFGTLWHTWKHHLDVKRFVALWFAAVAAYGLARHFAGKRARLAIA